MSFFAHREGGGQPESFHPLQPQTAQGGLRAIPRDRKSRRRNGLRAKARDEAIVPAPAAHGAKPYWLSLFIHGRKCQLSFENGSSIIFQTANHRAVNRNTIGSITGGIEQFRYLFQFFNPLWGHIIW